ncbi:MAG: hypothetical protein NUV47_00950 [Patescibacteria group bacterium]|nr:hypothetical protein [Patescibacteria group bacterium]
MKSINKSLTLFMVWMVVLFLMGKTITSPYYYLVIILLLIALTFVSVIKFSRISYRLISLAFTFVLPTILVYFWSIYLSLKYWGIPMVDYLVYEVALTSFIFLVLYVTLEYIFKYINSQTVNVVLSIFLLLISIALVYVNFLDYKVKESGFEDFDDSGKTMVMLQKIKSNNSLSVAQKFEALNRTVDFCNLIYSPAKRSKCSSEIEPIFQIVKSMVMTRSLFVSDPMSCAKLDGYQRRFCMESTLANTDDISICDKLKVAAARTQAVEWIKDDCLRLLSQPKGSRHF